MWIDEEYIVTSLYPSCTVFSWSVPRSLTATVLSIAMLEMLDMGKIMRSSVTVYVAMPPCTNPFVSGVTDPDDTYR